MFVWNKVKIPFSILDVETADKFDDHSKKMWGDLQEFEKGHTTDDGKLVGTRAILEECKIVKQFFDNMFGEGTSKKMFGSKNDISECVKAVKKLYTIRNQQLKDHSKKVLELQQIVTAKPD
jgi:hypothetical protein